jgi:hypothetical protein
MATSIITGTSVSSSLASSASFGDLRVKSQMGGATITTDDFGLQIASTEGWYALQVESPYENPLRVRSTDGTGGIDIGDNSSTNNYNRIQVIGNDRMEFYVNNVEMMELQAGEITINQGGANINTRIEGDNDENLLFIDAGQDAIGIGKGMNVGDEKFYVGGDVGITGSLHVSGNITTSGSIIAKEFRTEFVNQIVAQASGSTEFGDTIDDTHKFTGSLFVSGGITLPDYGPGASSEIRLGNGGDGKIYSLNDHLYIGNETSDKDIFIRANDGGSHGTAIQIDASAVRSVFLPNDNQVLGIGAGNDLRFWHDGTNSNIYNYVGNLNIGNATDDGDIILYSDDGSGNMTAYLTLDGGAERIQFDKKAYILDNVKFEFGTGADLRLYHDGSNSSIENHTGNLYIDQNTNDGEVIFRCDDGSGGLTTYLSFLGASSKLLLQRPTFIGSHAGVADSQLHVSESYMEAHIGSGSLQTVFETKGTSGNADFKIIDKDNNNARAALQVQGNAGAVECLFVGSAGNVGINNTSPSTELHIGGAPDGRTITFDQSGRINGIGSYFASNASDSQLWFYVSDGGTDGDTNIKMKLYASGDLCINDGGVSGSLTSTGSFGALQIADRGNSFTLGGHAGVARMTYNGSVWTFLDADNSYSSISAESGSFFGDVGIRAAKKLYFDDGEPPVAGHTYISEVSDDQLEIWVGATRMLRFSEAGTDYVNVMDNTRLGVGDGPDLQLYHNGTNSYINNTTGDLHISQSASDKDIRFSVNDGGTIVDMLVIDGSTQLFQFQNRGVYGLNNIQFSDPGSGEGISWSGGSWAIFISPDDMSNANGNLQFVSGSAGAGRVNGHIVMRGQSENTLSAAVKTQLYMPSSSLEIGNASAAGADVANDARVNIVSEGNERTMKLTANNDGTNGARSVSMEFQGYEGRAAGAYYYDINYTGHEWFVGTPYAANHQKFMIGYDDGGLGEYQASASIMIHPNSKVEIGTSTTNYDLQVYGNISHIVGNVSASITSTGSFSHLELGRKASNFASAAPNLRLATDGATQQKLASYDTNYYNHGYHTVENKTSNSTQLCHYGYYGHTFSTQAVEEALVVSRSGDVGIGNPKPTEPLVVEGVVSGSTFRSKNGTFDSQNASTNLKLRRGTNDDDIIEIEASETKIYGDAVERVRFGSYGIRNNYRGSDGTPPYSFIADTDTGMLSPGTNQLAFTTAGSRRYLIDASGNHGIYGNTDFSSPMTVQYGAVFNESGHDSDTRIESNDNANMFRVDAGNNRVGIGTGTPGYILHSHDSGADTRHKVSTSNHGTYMESGVTSDSAGIILVAGHNSSLLNIYLQNSGGSASHEFQFQHDGDFHADGDVIAASTTVSDKRLKDNVEIIPKALDKVKELRGVSFDWNKGGRKGQRDIGLIAQEVEKVLPELVREKKMALIDDKEYLTVDYDKMVAVLVEAVKEQQVQIEELKEDINKLQGDK